MSAPSTPDWLAELIAEEGEAKPIVVQERDALFEALSAAHAPMQLASERQQHILAGALDALDPLAPPTKEELIEAAQLRDHLDTDPLVVSLRSTKQCQLPSPELELRLRRDALRHMVQPKRPRSFASSIWGAFAVAAAAAIVVLARSNSPVEKFEASARPKPLALSRSTDSLFVRPFDSSSPSERIDKIAQVRAKDLRRNRYAIWGLP